MTKQTIKKSEAKQIRKLFSKHKKLIRTYKRTVDFKEPILILMRKAGKAEFYEKATSGEFNYVHSDKTNRTIILNTRQLQVFDYGNKTFKGYICHEDFPTALPDSPTLNSEMFTIAVEKTLADIKKWKAEELKQKGQFVWKLLIGIAAIILAYAMYKLLLPQQVTTAAPVIKDTVVQVINNTPTILGQ